MSEHVKAPEEFRRFFCAVSALFSGFLQPDKRDA